MSSFEQLFDWMKKPWVIALYAVLVGLIYYFADKPTAVFFHQLDTRQSLPVLNVLTAFGQWKAYIILFVFLGFYSRYVHKNDRFEARVWYLLGCVFIPNLVGFILKIAVSRARPDLLFSEHLFGFYWLQTKNLYWSFPSGHSLTVVGLASGLSVLFPRYFLVFFGLAILVVLSRVVLYHHYLSDVMTGFYLSILLVGFFTEYLKKKHYLNKMR
ncbi:phosphatase PAP2 family protein [Legionella worsleiensis]|uniref:undecaprenyl-diphosphate phosphatase n=1 Tax=Legionella worsleiensis TaxID=45076 RepID=A0A0W1A3V5_9GAMM|nr:phosphatase PAP2 family protein [Legionella worsleiensis]KTD76044.1 phosphatidylglycerophosphatase B [Legionella worsleiensis]STY33059.1 phosphatidylglycerophosphatase B [Legionella worsleiensis]